MVISATDAQLILSGGLVLFTAILAIVTFLYYQETKSHTKEMRESREAEFKPILSPTIEYFGVINIQFVFENTGKGAAYNVSAKWGFEHMDYTENWKSSLVVPGQRHKFPLPFGEDDWITSSEKILTELDNTKGKLYFEYECEDGLGNKISDRLTLDVKDVVELREGEVWQKDRQKELIKEIENVADAVEDVADKIEMSGLRAMLKRKNKDTVIEILSEHGDMKFGELLARSGIPQRDLAIILRRMKKNNFVDYDNETGLLGRTALDVEIELINK